MNAEMNINRTETDRHMRGRKVEIRGSKVWGFWQESQLVWWIKVVLMWFNVQKSP